MSEVSRGPGWWIASDGRWYPPALHPDAVAPPPPLMAVPGSPHGSNEDLSRAAPSELPPGALTVTYVGSGRTAKISEAKTGPVRRTVVAVLSVAAAAALGVIVYQKFVVPHRQPPPAGKAVVVPGQRTNILPNPDFLSACSAATFDDSSTCTSTTLQAINAARRIEGLPPMVLPSNWSALSPAKQLFVATNLERTARGLPPVTAMTDPLDAMADQAAVAGTDPSLPPGGGVTRFGANWIQGYSSPLEAIYEWLYDDGLGSSNTDCTRQDLSSCWGHRSNVLITLECTSCMFGAAFAPQDAHHEPLSFAEILVEDTAAGPPTFTWAEENRYLRH